MEKRNSQLEHGQPMEKKTLDLHVRLVHGSLSITRPISLLANEFDVQSVLHGQVSLAAINLIYVIHEAMNGCKKSKDSLKDCFENVNIYVYKLSWKSYTIEQLDFNTYKKPNFEYCFK